MYIQVISVLFFNCCYSLSHWYLTAAADGGKGKNFSSLQFDAVILVHKQLSRSKYDVSCTETDKILHMYIPVT